jgi:hypothetical protein
MTYGGNQFFKSFGDGSIGREIEDRKNNKTVQVRAEAKKTGITLNGLINEYMMHN